MTKEQHIQHWIDTAQYDWEGAEGAFGIKRYLHCLFWAHLTLEKLAKAHWVKTNTDNIPPKVHNIVWILEEANVDLGEDIIDFLKEFNRFQLSGRYPDYMDKMYKTCTEVYTFKQLEKAKEIRQCLIEML